MKIIPITIHQRLKLKSASKSEAGNNVLIHDTNSKEVASIPKDAFLSDVNKRIDGIVFPNGFTKTGTITRAGNQITIQPLAFEWKIELNPYTNTLLFDETIVATSLPELNRIDTIGATKENTLILYQGEEVDATSVAIPPVLPTDVLRLTDIYIYGNDVTETTEPFVSEVFTLAEKEKLATIEKINPATDTTFGTVKTDVLKAEPVVYVKETVDQLLEGKANYFLDVKPITGISYNVLIDDILNELVYDGTLPMNVIIPNNDTVPFPIGTIFYTLATNTGILSASGGTGVVLKVKSGISLSAIQNEVRQYTKIGINTWSVRGDLNLGAVTQLELSYLQGATSNIQQQINDKVAFNGTPNFLVKFLTNKTAAVSRLFDNGTFFGIGTVNTPTKDITLGRQGNKKIGVEQSNNTSVGRDLTISAGKTINFLENTNFNLYQAGNFTTVCKTLNNDIYICGNGTHIFKQTASAGAFIDLGGSSYNAGQICSDSSNNVYISTIQGNIYKQSNSTGSFNLYATIEYELKGIWVMPNGDFYAAITNGDIYVQTGGTGSFVALGQIHRPWSQISNIGNDTYIATVGGNTIYKRIGGTGNFVSLPSLGAGWFTGLTSNVSGMLFVVYNSIIYSSSDFGETWATYYNGASIWPSATQMCTDVFGNIYIVDSSGLYIQNNYAVGTPNLDGGTLIQEAGTGKGTGKSRYEIWTGQKTSSGTDMQISTLREYVDENGYHVYTSMPIHADNAAAITAGLPVGCEYRTATGQKMIVY